MTFSPTRYRRSIVALFRRDLGRIRAGCKRRRLSRSELLALDHIAATALKLSRSVSEAVSPPCRPITPDDDLLPFVRLRGWVRRRLAKLDSKGGPQS